MAEARKSKFHSKNSAAAPARKQRRETKRYHIWGAHIIGSHAALPCSYVRAGRRTVRPPKPAAFSRSRRKTPPQAGPFPRGRCGGVGRSSSAIMAPQRRRVCCRRNPRPGGCGCSPFPTFVGRRAHPTWPGHRRRRRTSAWLAAPSGPTCLPQVKALAGAAATWARLPRPHPHPSASSVASAAAPQREKAGGARPPAFGEEAPCSAPRPRPAATATKTTLLRARRSDGAVGSGDFGPRRGFRKMIDFSQH